MKLDIAYKMVKTWMKGDGQGSYDLVEVEPSGLYWHNASVAMERARANADSYIKYGQDLDDHAELNIINGDDQLVINIRPIILVDGVEVETDTYQEPIQTLTVNKLACEHH